MSGAKKLLHAAAGTSAASGGATYVEDVFSTHLYTGNGSDGKAINNGIDLDGEGGLVWIKGRAAGGASSGVPIGRSPPSPPPKDPVTASIA